MPTNPTSIFGINIEGIQGVIQALKTVESKFLDLEKRVKAAERSFDKYGDSVKKSSKEQQKATKTQQDFNNDLDEFNKRLTVAIQKIITYRLAFGAFREATEAFSRVIDLTIEMDNLFGDLRKVLDTSEAGFASLERAAFRMGKEFGRTGAEVAESFLVFGQQGLQTSEILERTRATLLAVSSSTLSVKEAVESLTAVVNNFDPNMVSATDAVDKWAKVAASAPVSAKDLADSMLSVGATARQVGLTIDELNGIVAAVTEVTRRTGKFIGTALRTILARVRRPEVIKQLQDLGVLSQTTREDFRNFGNVLRDLNKEWDNLSEVQQFNIAVAASGVRRYNTFLALMKNFDRFQETVVDSTNAFGFAQQATLAETQKFSRQIQSLKTSVEELGVELGKAGIIQALIVVNQLMASLAEIVKGSGRELLVLNAGLASLLTLLAAAKGAILLVSKAFSTAAFSLGKFSAILTLAAIAGNVLTTVLLKNKRANDAFKNTLSDIELELQQTERSAIKSKEALDEFDKVLARRKALRNLEALNRQIIANRNEFQELRDEGFKFLEVLTDIELAQIALQRGRGFGRERDERLIALQEEKRLLEAQRAEQEALLAQAEGRDVDPLQFRAVDIEEANIALERVQRLIAGATRAQDEFINKGREEFRFPGLDQIEVAGKQIGDVLKARDIDLTRGGELGVQTLIDTLEKYKNDIIETRDKVLQLKDSNEDLEDPARFRLADAATKANEEFSKIIEQVKQVEDRVRDAAVQADLLGKPFDAISLRVEFLSEALENARTTNKKFTDDFNTALIRAKAAGVDIQATLNAMEPRLAEIAKSSDASGASQEEAREAAEKLLEAFRNQEVSLKQFPEIQKQIIALLTDESRALAERPKLIFRAQAALAAQTSEISRQQALLKVISSALTGISRSRLLETKTLQQQQALQRQSVDLEFQKAVAIADAELEQRRLIQGEATKEDILKRNLAIINAIINRQEELNDIRLRGVENLIRENAALVDQLSSGLAAGISDLPSRIEQRAQAEEELAQRRLELERELAQARIEEDDVAIQNALDGLEQIRIEQQNLGGFVDDLFFSLEGIADVVRNKLSEIIADQLISTTLGETLADGILQGSTAGAIQLRNKAIEGIAIGSQKFNKQLIETIALASSALGRPIDVDEIQRKIEQADFSDDLEDNIKLGADRLELGLKAAFQFGSALLIQSLFGGGRGASTGGFLGGLIGGIFGPVGTAIGTLAGGFLGSQFDRNERFIPPLRDNTEELKKNTTAIQNNNRLLELEREFVNAPARFVAPPTRGQFGGGISGGANTITIQNLNVAGGSEGARQFIDALDRAFTTSSNTTGSRTPFSR